jgi:hypothetical protein
VLNLFLGWTFLGWIAALVFSSQDEYRVFEPFHWSVD